MWLDKAVNFGDDWRGKEIVLFDEMLPYQKFVVDSDGILTRQSFDNPIWQNVSRDDLEIKILNQIFYLDTERGWAQLEWGYHRRNYAKWSLARPFGMCLSFILQLLMLQVHYNII